MDLNTPQGEILRSLLYARVDKGDIFDGCIVGEDGPAFLGLNGGALARSAHGDSRRSPGAIGADAGLSGDRHNTCRRGRLQSFTESFEPLARSVLYYGIG